MVSKSINFIITKRKSAFFVKFNLDMFYPCIGFTIYFMIFYIMYIVQYLPHRLWLHYLMVSHQCYRLMKSEEEQKKKSPIIIWFYRNALNSFFILSRMAWFLSSRGCGHVAVLRFGWKKISEIVEEKNYLKKINDEMNEKFTLEKHC